MLTRYMKLSFGFGVCLLGIALQIIVGLDVLIQYILKSFAVCQTLSCGLGLSGAILFELSLVIIPCALALNAIRWQKLGPLWLFSWLAAFTSSMMLEINWVSGYFFCPGALILFMGGVAVFIELLRRRGSRENANESSSLPQSERQISARKLLPGLLVWMLSLGTFYVSWLMIFSTSQYAGGSYPGILRWLLFSTFAISIIWSIVATTMFRRQSYQLMAENSLTSLQNARGGMFTNIACVIMIVCPFMLIAVFWTFAGQ